MNKKIISIFVLATSIFIIIFIVILVPILMIMNFFGIPITDGYVANNHEYASEYKKVLNQNIKNKNGYVSLHRILYFYLADDSLSFEEVYSDNLDKEEKILLPIQDVCKLSKYKYLEVCKEENISASDQINEKQYKPFAPPIDFSSSTITSFFMEERIVYDKANIHKAWDIANKAQTPVYSVCDGKVETVSFPYSTNSIDTKDIQGGNIIKINCEINNLIYTVWYKHLFPNSSKVQIGNEVYKGEEIASVGTTGYSTGNHLHYEVSLNGNKVDGMSLIDFHFKNDY